MRITQTGTIDINKRFADIHTIMFPTLSFSGIWCQKHCYLWRVTVNTTITFALFILQGISCRMDFETIQSEITAVLILFLEMISLVLDVGMLSKFHE